jgi:hypothetical protein
MFGIAGTRRFRGTRTGTAPAGRKGSSDAPTIRFKLQPRLTLGVTEPGSSAGATITSVADRRPVPKWAAVVRKSAPTVALAAVILVAGGAIAVVIPVLAVISRWRPRWTPAIAMSAMLASGLIAASARTPTLLGSGPFSGTAQVFALLALAAALLPINAGSLGLRRDSGPATRDRNQG